MSASGSQRELVAVVGSGPSGLAAAFRLHQAGYGVRLFEAAERLGGKLRTTERDGFVIDEGASVLPTSYGNLIAIVEAAGLEGELVRAGSIMGFVRDGVVHELDTERLWRSALRFGLLSNRSKFTLGKLAIDAARIRRYLSFEDLSGAARFDGESAAGYAGRRLNREILEFLVEPAARSLVGVGADEASSIDLLFSLTKFVNARFLAFRRGMSSYAELLGGRFEVQLGARVLWVRETNGAVEVTWSCRDGSEHTLDVAGCVIATPAPVAAAIRHGLDAERLAYLQGLRYSTMVTANLALASPPGRLAASYLQIPPSVHPGLNGIVLEHNKASHGVPPGKGLVTVYTVSAWARQLAAEDDGTVLHRLVPAVETVLPGVGDHIEFALVGRWDPMTVHRRPGEYGALRTFVERSRSLDRRIQLAGDYFSASNVNSATAAGERAARDLLAAIDCRR